MFMSPPSSLHKTQVTGQRIEKLCRAKASYTENCSFSMKTAFVFPGQGSQYVGMGKSLAEKFAAARAIFDQADQALGFSLTQLCFEGPAEDAAAHREHAAGAADGFGGGLARAGRAERPTGFCGRPQPGRIQRAGGRRSRWTFADAVRLVRKRGQYMQEAVPVGVGAMAALLKLPAGQARLRSGRSVAGRGGDRRELQFAGPGGDCRARRRRRPSRRTGQSRRSQASADASGERAVPLPADGARAATPEGGPGRHRISRSGRAAGERLASASDSHWSRSARRSVSAGAQSGALDRSDPEAGIAGRPDDSSRWARVACSPDCSAISTARLEGSKFGEAEDLEKVHAAIA